MANKLTEHHPLFKKVQKLEELMQDMKITIYTVGGLLFIKDEETGIVVGYKDMGDGSDITNFPYGFEIKLRVVE